MLKTYLQDKLPKGYEEVVILLKSWLWTLQNPNISAVISNLWDEQHLKENLSVAGKKVELQPG